MRGFSSATASRRRSSAVPLRSGQSNDKLGRRHKPDYWLVTLCVILLAVGLIVVYAISPALSASTNVPNNYYVIKQLIAIALSIVAFVITAQVPLELWRKAYKPLLLAAAGATLLALALPVNPAYPAHRWVRLGSFSFQSVELVKFAALVAVAGFFAAASQARNLGDWQKTLKPLFIAILIGGVLIAGPQKLRMQSDLGSMAVMIAMLGSMAFVVGMPKRRLVQIGAVLAIGVVLVIIPSAYRLSRLTTFTHQSTNCQDAGYQACQALIAVGSGGMFGLGIGRSVQANGYLPEAANDSIFAIYAEVFGFVGVLVLLGLYLGLFNRLKHIAERAPDDFSRLLTIGVLSWLSVQTLINIGAMIGLLPLKGITLPFISYGGTSIVFVAAAIGLIFQVSRYTSYTVPMNDERSEHDNSRDRRRVRGAYHPDFGSR